MIGCAVALWGLGTVDDRVHELLGQEARIRRSYLAVTHGVGENVGNQFPRVNGILVVGERQLRELMRFGCNEPLKRNGRRRQRSFRKLYSDPH